MVNGYGYGNILILIHEFKVAACLFSHKLSHHICLFLCTAFCLWM